MAPRRQTTPKAIPKMEELPIEEKVDDPKTEKVEKILSIKTPTDVAQEYPDHEKHILQGVFHDGKQYVKGTLIIQSEKPIPELNARNDVLVLSKLTVQHLARANVTVPMEDEKPQDADQE